MNKSIGDESVVETDKEAGSVGENKPSNGEHVSASSSLNESKITDLIQDSVINLEERLGCKFNQLATNICQSIANAINDAVSNYAGQLTDHGELLRSENSSLKNEILELNKQLSNYKLIASGLNSRNKDLENERKSLIAVIKILQEEQEHLNKQKPWNENEKHQHVKNI